MPDYSRYEFIKVEKAARVLVEKRKPNFTRDQPDRRTVGAARKKRKGERYA